VRTATSHQKHHILKAAAATTTTIANGQSSWSLSHIANGQCVVGSVHSPTLQSSNGYEVKAPVYQEKAFLV